MAKIFEAFSAGKLCCPDHETDFNTVPWSKHPKFDGVEMKHIITAKETEGQFSFHLIRIAPGHNIGLHIHETQLETHEVIEGEGVCVNNGLEIKYGPGVISIFQPETRHEVKAGDQGLCMFAKFWPALC